jgi:hypothetical protein
MSKNQNSADRISHADVEILRRLGETIRTIAESPVNAERRRAWYALDSGQDDRVMILAEHNGVLDAKRPMPAEVCQCQGEWARGVEQGLRTTLYLFETLKDDHVVEPVLNVQWHITCSNYGVEVVMHHSDSGTPLGARRWDAPIKDLDRDFAKLRPRTFTVDRAATLAAKARLESVFNGVLPVRIRGGFYWTMGMTWPAVELIGLEQLMLAMFDNPAGLHRLMAFLRDDHLAFTDWLEQEGLYSLNNENDYIGSGSLGYSRALPQADWKPGEPVRKRDLWMLSESQETVGVGPEQFAEFIFPYQYAVAERFGRLYYGCCEPVHNRWHVIRNFPNLARVSVSPWADQAYMAQAVGRNCVFSRKPNPTLISTQVFDEDAIRADLRQTIEAARDCRLEIVMKDVHTLNNEPERLPRWVQLAREEAARK